MSDITDLCQIIHRGIGLNFEDLAEEIIAAGFHRDRIIDTAEAAIARVREIHQPVDALNVAIGKVQQVCTGCGKDDGNWETWPCPTIRALDEGGRR